MLQWFSENAERIALKVYRDRYTDNFLPHVFDYLVTTEFSGQKYWGRGIDEVEINALNAACAEMVERATIHSQKASNRTWHPGGTAAHPSLQDAEDRAKRELVERDSFFSHFLTKMPFFEIQAHLTVEQIRKKLEPHGITVRVGGMCSPKGLRSVVTACFGASSINPFGVFIGSSSGRTAEEALLKSIKESVALVAGHLRSKEEKDSMSGSAGPLFNHRVASLPESAVCLERFFINSASGSHLNAMNALNIATEPLDLHPAFAGCPVTVVRATSPDAQQLFFGETKPEHINFKRLSQFLGKDVRWEDVNKTTHVFA